MAINVDKRLMLNRDEQIVKNANDIAKYADIEEAVTALKEECIDERNNCIEEKQECVRQAGICETIKDDTNSIKNDCLDIKGQVEEIRDECADIEEAIGLNKQDNIYIHNIRLTFETVGGSECWCTCCYISTDDTEITTETQFKNYLYNKQLLRFEGEIRMGQYSVGLSAIWPDTVGSEQVYYIKHLAYDNGFIVTYTTSIGTFTSIIDTVTRP